MEKNKYMTKANFTQSILITLVILGVQCFGLSVQAQEFSTDPLNPALLENDTISGELMPKKNKEKFYFTFLAGPGDIFFDIKISPKDNKGAVFFWNVYRGIDEAVKDNLWCTENLYQATEAQSRKCVVASGDQKTRQVVLGFGAYPNGDPVNISYTIKISGDWKPLSGSKVSTLDLSLRPALYVTAFHTGQLNPKDPFGSPQKAVTVFRSDNTNCDQAACGFRVGFYVFRNNALGKLTTKVKVTNGKFSKTETVTFQPGQKVAEAVINLPVSNGGNLVTVSVDPPNEPSHANKNNNSFKTTVILKP
jgi:hypothetical protein